jgi:2-amino-4-hydroxy-6-hydroxymethyldihydropteridine diphosphokinase
MRVGIALGSNLGDRSINLLAARNKIVGLAGIQPPILFSSIYETEPVDCEPDANKFFNAVLEFDYAGDPQSLLRNLKAIENSLGRPGDHARNISRSIDIDLLYAADIKIDDERLHLPHPRMHLRRFVLAPLAEIRPDLILPNQTKAVAQLLANLNDPAGVVRLKDQW